MRFFSLATDYKYAIGRLSRQEIFTDGPQGGLELAFTIETAASSSRLPGLHLDGKGQTLIIMPQASLDFEVVTQACHIWMAHQGIPEQPIWFLALPPGKDPAEFLTF